MISNKRRKLDPPAVRKNISAYAARKQLQAVTNSDVSSFEGSEKPNGLHSGRNFNTRLIASSEHEVHTFHEGLGCEIVVGSKDNKLDDDSFADSPEDDDELAVDPAKESHVVTRSESSEQSVLQLTTIDLNGDNVKELKDGCIHIKIAPGEKLVVLGEYGISVIKGQVTILGATLYAGKVIHVVHATLSHSLPVIRFRASESGKAEVRLHHVHTGLRSLRNLSPLFSGLWNDRSTLLGSNIESPSNNRPSKVTRKQSFKILLSTRINPRNVLRPVISPPEWNELLFKSVSEGPKLGKTALTMICGPKSSGKSTFARLLANFLLTNNNTNKHVLSKSGSKSDKLVALLDLDPGQPEYSPPGQLSLVLLSRPNFGPPYSHPNASQSGQKVLRAHSIAAVSPSADPRFYMECATDLLLHYFDLQPSSPCPLIINTAGWVLGTGLEMLLDLVRKARPTQVIYMSQEGPHEVVQGLRDAANLTPVLTLPSQPTEYMVRTASHLRTMQYMSYFHLDPRNIEQPSWNTNSITSLAPWEVKYGGKGPGILGVLCLGEQPSTSMLKNTLDGTLLAIVVLDDKAALHSRTNRQQDLGDKSELFDNGDHGNNMDNSCLSLQVEEKLERSFIIRTPEGIPYFEPASVTTLDPRYSRTVGLALVRGIDSKRQRLQILTPVPETILKDLMTSGKPIVLVSGKLDTPGWAYTEDFYKRAANKKWHNNPQVADVSDYDWEDSGGDEQNSEQVDECYGEGSEIVPWTERLYGHEGRGVGARVWRVRRDLGRIGVGD